MARYFLGCMHEQYHPRELLEQAVAGERAGFDGIACSDHFQPWWRSGHAGQAWIWLGAAAQATERVPVGPAVTVALHRYHPALVAQGFATLEAMYPGRVFVGLGSGESLNESPLGLDWPSPAEQLVALEEACRLIRRLWEGERVDHEGKFFRTKGAYLHTRPDKPPPLYVSAFHPGAARVAGRYGDGLWTMTDPEAAPKLVDAYREAAEQARRDTGTLVLETGFSWAPSDEEALEAARVWKGPGRARSIPRTGSTHRRCTNTARSRSPTTSSSRGSSSRQIPGSTPSGSASSRSWWTGTGRQALEPVRAHRARGDSRLR